MTFSGPDRPTGIFASFDSLAEMIYMLLPRLGLRVPNDFSLIGEGGIWREGVITRRLTSVVVDEIATGRKAVDLLSEMRRGDRAIDDNTEIVLELGLSDGETLATPASAK
jgi:DNA-binding LacI/PurR family transcriptional regulator